MSLSTLSDFIQLSTGDRKLTLQTPQILAVIATASLFWLAACQPSVGERSEPATPPSTTETELEVQYLEIVTPDVDATCATLSSVHGVQFGPPESGFGNARIAILTNGRRIGVRAPLSADEGAPIVQPYLLVENIDAAIASAEATGAEFAMLATEIPGHGTFAIYFQGGLQFGLCEN